MDGKIVRRYLRVVKRWWWLLVLSAVVPMAVSYYFASKQLDLYRAEATIIVATSLQNADPDPWQMSLSDALVDACAEMVRQGPVIEAVIERLGLKRTPEQLAAQIGTSVHLGAHLLEIQVTDTNPQVAALTANTLADELIRRSPASGGSDPAQQEFIRGQLENLQNKIEQISEDIRELSDSFVDLTSTAELEEAQDRIAALEEVKFTYQATYADLLALYRSASSNVLSLFDPAVIPQWPVPSRTKLIVAVAGPAGLGLALGVIFLIEYLDTSLRWEGDGVQSIMKVSRYLEDPVVAVGCLLAAGLAETLAVWADPRLGLILHGLVLLALFFYAAFDSEGKVGRLCLVLALVPLIRIALVTALSTSLSTTTMLLLITFLVLKELASTLEGRWQVFGRFLSIAIVPLLITFFTTAAIRTIDILR